MPRQKTVQQLCITGLFVFFFILMLKMFSPFFSVLLWAILFYILISPLHRRLLAKISPQKKFYEFKRQLLAVLFSAATIALIIGPLIFLGILFVRQLIGFIQEIEVALVKNPDLFSPAKLEEFMAPILSVIAPERVADGHFNLYREAMQVLQSYSSTLFEYGTHIAGNIGSFGFSLVLMLFALYFFYLDGQYLAGLFSKAIPINPGQMSSLIGKFTEITRHLFSGYILVALYQGAASFVIMTIFGIKGALLFSVTLMLCSFIPIFGAATVWLPVGISLCAQGPLWKGIVFLALSAVCISFLDNFLRPFFLKDRIQVHPLVIFFSILGGLAAFGFNGLVLGPTIIIMFFTVLDMLTSSELS